MQTAENIPDVPPGEDTPDNMTMYMYKTGEYENVTEMRVGSKMCFLLAAHVCISHDFIRYDLKYQHRRRFCWSLMGYISLVVVVAKIGKMYLAEYPFINCGIVELFLSFPQKQRIFW